MPLHLFTTWNGKSIALRTEQIIAVEEVSDVETDISFAAADDEGNLSGVRVKGSFESIWKYIKAIESMKN